MDEKLERFMEASSTAWDNYRGPAKPVSIFVFTDLIGGTWDVKNMLAPCGGPAESRGNSFRQFWFCSKHPSEGVLILQYRNSSWYWFEGKMEVAR